MTDSAVPCPHFFSRSVDDFGGKVSFIITDCIDALRRMNAKNNEGLFRLNAPNRLLIEASHAMDYGRVSKIPAEWDHHTMACILKKHFRDQDDKLMPPSVMEKCGPIIEAGGPDTNEKFIAKFREILTTLSRPRYYSLVLLVKYLVEVCDNPDNKMKPYGMSVCFSPNIFKCVSDNPLRENELNNKLFQLVVELGHQLFDDVEVPREMYLTDADIQKLMARTMETKDAKAFLDWRQMRRKSLIPFLPTDLSSVPGFERPAPIKK